MARSTTLLFAAAIAVSCAGAAYAQGTSNLIRTAQATTKADKAAAAKAKREEAAQNRAEQKQKRADCSKQATEQKLHLLKRTRFINECMKT